MEIDLDNLVFSGLEEAQERNAEPIKKRRPLLPTMTAATPVRSNDETGCSAGFFYLPLPRDGYKNAFNAPILPFGRLPATLNL